MESINKRLTHNLPEQFRDSQITPPRFIPYYLDPKLKYSPGIPFLAKLKTRWELRVLGYEEAFMESTVDNMNKGNYLTQFYHAFGKSQGVPVRKILAGKDIRTVTAQDLTTYFIDQGGLLVEADATAFDSHLNPFPFEGLKRLGEKSFESHWKKEAISSVFHSKYDNLQSVWIFNITEYPHEIFELGLDNPLYVHKLLRDFPTRYISYKDFLNHYNDKDFLKDKI
ncbi:26964_t:CDS:2, partial [Racocetra persica]